MPLWAFWEQPLRVPAPHLTCATNNPDYIFLWHSKPAPDDRWALSKALQLARVRCNYLPQQHAQLRRLLLSFPKRKLLRQVCTNCIIHETYVSQRLTNLCFVPNPICHSPTGGEYSRLVVMSYESVNHIFLQNHNNTFTCRPIKVSISTIDWWLCLTNLEIIYFCKILTIHSLVGL